MNFFFDIKFSRLKPRIPAVRDEIRIAVLLIITNCSAWAPVNARFVTNIDIVKPIPPRQATPINIFHEVFCGISHSPSLTQIHDNSVMPRGLPTTKPKNMPKNTGESKIWSIGIDVPVSDTPELARANAGITMNETNPCRPYSSRCDGLIVFWAVDISD